MTPSTSGSRSIFDRTPIRYWGFIAAPLYAPQNPPQELFHIVLHTSNPGSLVLGFLHSAGLLSRWLLDVQLAERAF